MGRSLAINQSGNIRIGESDQLKTGLAMDEQEIEQHRSQPNYQKFTTMVKRCMDQKIRVRNFEGRNERIEREQGECYQWEEQGQCTRGDDCSFRHDGNKRGNATQSSSPTPKPQTQSDGKNLGKEKLSGAVVLFGKRFQRPCKDYIRGSSCDFWRPPECQHCKTQSGCKFGEKCVFRDKVLTASKTQNRKRLVVKARLPERTIPSNSVACSRI